MKGRLFLWLIDSSQMFHHTKQNHVKNFFNEYMVEKVCYGTFASYTNLNFTSPLKEPYLVAMGHLCAIVHI